MIPSVIEIGSPNLYLSKTRGFLSIRNDEGQVQKLPLDNIGVLVITSPRATLSTALMNTLSERGIIAVLCDQKHRPASYLYPLKSHAEMAGRLFDQIEARKPLKKRLWQQVVQAKISNQAWLLGVHGRQDALRLENMADEVVSGDKENKEAQAARLYWQNLLGREFRRIPREEGANRMLDFGYGILRSACLRAIAGSGLHPSLGVSHHSRRNPFCLADDLMEPYRPVVDAMVFMLCSTDRLELDATTKSYLAKILSLPMKRTKGYTPLGRALAEITQSLVRSYANKKNMLLIPSVPRDLNREVEKLWLTMDFS